MLVTMMYTHLPLCTKGRSPPGCPQLAGPPPRRQAWAARSSLPATPGSASVNLWQVDIVHRGQVSLKGVPQPVVVLMLVPLMLSGRTFPEALPGAKAQLMAGPKGLQLSVKLPSDP